jgi:6-phosphogluconolactonase (cycloisomerase 2 family)
MRAITRIGVAASAAVAALCIAGAPALAAPTFRAVFVQTDNLKGNQIVAYDRSGEGTLTQAGVYDTGGLGGQLAGSVVDHLASQGSLAYDRGDGLLYAVNAGSNTVSVFAVLGDKLALRQVIGSGGSYPVSIAVSNGVVYVLNGLDGGSLQGFAVSSGRLVSIPGSNRSLGLATSEAPQFTHTPGMVAFSPGGSQLLVTTKAGGESVDVFAVYPGGALSATPVVNPLPGTVPFAVSFDRRGHVILAEAAGFLASLELKESGVLEQLDAVGSEQAATCWVARARAHFYTSNAGSGSLSTFSSSFGGQLLTLLGDTPTGGGTVDAAATPEGGFLYVQTGAEGDVDEFAVGAQGALSEVGSVTVPNAVGGEGIVAG